jgi:hypothetical protein
MSLPLVGFSHTPINRWTKGQLKKERRDNSDLDFGDENEVDGLITRSAVKAKDNDVASDVSGSESASESGEDAVELDLDKIVAAAVENARGR